MRICRVMSLEELHLLTSYVTIEARPQPKHSKTGYHAPRICFFPTEIENLQLQLLINSWTNGDVVVHFEADESLLTRDFGVYPDWTSNDWNSCICLQEYHVPEYSRELFQPLYWEWRNDLSGERYPIP